MSTPSSPPSSPPPTQRFHEKQATILNAATTLFNRLGVKGATLNDIAGSVGLVTNSLTYYYRKKEDLATACFLRTIEMLSYTVARASALPTVPQRIHEFMRLRAEQAQGMVRGDHPPMVYFHDLRALPDPQFKQVTAAYNAMFGKVREMLRSPETAHFARGDLSARSYITLAASHWIPVWAERHDVNDYPKLSELIADLLLNGMASKTAAAASFETAPPWRLEHTGDSQTDAFLRAATRLVNENGYRGASVDMISAHLNVTKGSFYHHNDKKEDLIAECFERSFAITRRAFDMAEQMNASGWDRVCAFSKALSRFQLSPHGPLMRIAAMSSVSDREQGERVRRTLEQFTERLGMLLTKGMMDGSLRPQHPIVVAQLVGNLVNSAPGVGHWVGGVTEDNVADVYVRPLLLGVLCGPSKERAAPVDATSAHA